jgi:hypothetical protein
VAETERPDNVTRGIEFGERHPEIEIKSPRETGDRFWHATWREGKMPEGAEPQIHASLELGWLLDELERRFDRQ